MSVGGDHTCGVTSVTGGATYCWGYNGYGALGDSAAEPQSASPVLVKGGVSFATVSAGTFHTCALTTIGAAYCWGWNLFGELGNNSAAYNGTQAYETGPVAVVGGLTFVQVTAGHFYTCGVGSGRASYCWGSNHSGQFGNGVMNAVSDAIASPVLVASYPRVFVGLSAGSANAAHTCGIYGDGAYCWGDNTSGELGNGTTTSSAAPVQVIH